jgi:deoxyuridine 5'-triphosphate nucleotidohydrolase
MASESTFSSPNVYDAYILGTFIKHVYSHAATPHIRKLSHNFKTCDEIELTNALGKIDQDEFLLNASEKQKKAFYRGAMDTLCYTISDGTCSVENPDGVYAHMIRDTPLNDVPYTVTNEGCFVYSGINVLDLLGNMYDMDIQHLNSTPNYYCYKQMISNGTFNVPKMLVYRVCADAVMPSKVRTSDVGYDLTIVREAKRMGENTILYDTGIKVCVPVGYYCEVVPRSSLSKMGWVLANSIGIIDPAYRGSILVAVTRVEPNAPCLPLPFRGFQLIIRKQHHVDVEETYDDLESTHRGDGGFGSTNN